MIITSKILITGARGLLGTALVNELKNQGFMNLFCPSSKELNLLDNTLVKTWFDVNKPEYVFHLASLVFGLKGNMDNQLKSIHQNTQMNLNLFDACGNNKVKKIFFAGTVASYPYPYPSLPLKEEFFTNGEPHGGEYGYATAKRHALSYLKILKETKNVDYCYGIFTNLYGMNDKFDTNGGHVIPSLIKKAYDAINSDNKLFKVWGKPETTRDFLYVEDAAKICILAFNNISGILNIASGRELTMGDIVEVIEQYFDGKLNVVWDSEAPIGIPKRSVCIDRLNELNPHNLTSIANGLQKTIDWYIQNSVDARK